MAFSSTGSRPSNRRAGFGPGEWLLLALPVISGIRLRVAAGSRNDVIAADMLTDMAGPGLALMAFAVGAGARIALPQPVRDDSALLRRASTLRMLALTVAASLGLLIVFPVDLVSPSGPWRRMLAWTLGVALPVWAAGMYALTRGRSSATAVLASLGLGAAPTAIAIGLGMSYGLPAGALVVPATVAGLVCGGGAALAAWFGAGAPGWLVLPALAAVAVGPTLGVVRHHALVPIESLDSEGLVAYDRTRDRALIRVGRMDTLTARLAEVDLKTGKTELLSPLDRAGMYVTGKRVTWRRTPLHHATNRAAPRDLCVHDGRDVRCRKAVLPAEGGAILFPHPRRPLVLATTTDRILVWNVDSDDLKEWVGPVDARIRWPCFVGDDILYRLQGTAPGPYSHHLLRTVTMQSEGLPEEHELQCEPTSRVEPEARFIRGRRRTGTPSRIESPDLDGGALFLADPVKVAAWSADGSTLALLFDSPRLNLGGHIAGHGTFPRVGIPNTSDIHVSHDGSMVGFGVKNHRRRWTINVSSLPDGKPLSSVPADSYELFWDGSGRILFDTDRAFVALSPRSGKITRLFPPATR